MQNYYIVMKKEQSRTISSVAGVLGHGGVAGSDRCFDHAASRKAVPVNSHVALEQRNGKTESRAEAQRR